MMRFKASLMFVVSLLSLTAVMAVEPSVSGMYRFTYMQSGALLPATGAQGAGYNLYLPSSTFLPAQKSQVSDESMSIFHGVNRSATVFDFGRDASVLRGFVPLQPRDTGIMTQRVALRIIVGGTESELGVAVKKPTGWYMIWASKDQVPQHATVQLKARAFDGFSWGAWAISDPFVIDNEAPIISSAQAFAEGMTLNSGQGRLSLNWTMTDNLPGVTYTLYEVHESSLAKVNQSSLRFWFDANDPDYLTENSGGKVSLFIGKGLRDVVFTQTESDHQPTVVVDTASGKSFLRFGTQQFMTTTLPEIATGSFTVYAVYKPLIDSKRLSLVQFLGTTPLALSVDKPTSFLQTRTGIIDAAAPLRSAQLIIQIMTYDHVSRKLTTYLNGNVVAEKTLQLLNLNGQIILGNQPGNLAFAGDLAEWVVVDNTASVDPDIQNYLGIKWGTRFYEPSAVANLSLWIDKSLPKTNRGPKWVEKSHNHQVVQVQDFKNPAMYPLTADAETYFHSSNGIGMGVMDSPVQNDLTVMMVYKLNPATQGGKALLKFLGEVNEKIEIAIPTGNQRQVTLQKSSQTQNTAVNRINLDQSVLSVLTFSDDGGKMKLYQNGALISEMDSARFSSGSATRWKRMMFGEVESDIGEILVYDRVLTEEERESAQKLLMNKWGGAGALRWAQSQSGEGNGEFSEIRQDNTYFRYKIVAEDAAGNRAEYLMPGLFTPDRTPPQLNGGLINSPAFDMIRGQEDKDIAFNLMSFQSDNVDAGDKLTWSVDVYMSQGSFQDPMLDRNRSAQEVIRSAVIRNGQLIMLVSPNMNTAPSVLGNRFGKENAFIKLTLRDKAGNSFSKDIQIFLDPVNDAPFFKSDVLGGLYYRDSQTKTLVYNIKFDEDTIGSLNINDFIDDVDDELNVLTIAVSGNANLGVVQPGDIPNPPTLVYQEGDRPYDAETEAKFRSDLIDYFVMKPNADGRQLRMQAVQDWYGDQSVELRVADRQYAVSTPFKVRVWPVNDPPKITNDMPVYLSVDEEETISFDLHGFESDTRFEDEVPTFHNQLNWTPISYDTSKIKSVSINQLTDVVTIIPSANTIGATSVIFELRDTDRVPITKFNIRENYIPNPKAVTISVTFEWLPVNDKPTIGSVPDVRTTEDASVLSIDLSSFKSDVEDTPDQLTWSLDSVSSQNLFAAEIVGDILKVTPVANAWGEGSLRLILTDTDSALVDLGYDPRPTSSYKTIPVTVGAVNDAPQLQGLSIHGKLTQNPFRLLSTDTLLVSVLGYQDVGYSNNAIRSAIGNEYAPENNINLNFLKNAPRYNYTYRIKQDGTLIQTITSNALTSSQNQLVLISSYEGKTIEVEATPFDLVSVGSAVTSSIKVNITPPLVSRESATPFGDYWTDTNNITLGWGSVTDDENDPVGYQLMIWSVQAWDSPAPDTTKVTPFRVVPFSTELTSPQTLNLPDGHYYWTVYSGNEIDPNQWDYKKSTWLHSFHLDTQAPIVSTQDAIVFTNLLRSSGSVSDAGKSRVVYGTKPELSNESSLYAVIVNAVNTNLDNVTTQKTFQLVATSNRDDWTGRINFPNGTTEYTVTIRDNVGHESTYLTFQVTEDTVPPTAPDLSHFSKLSLVNGVYQGMASANYMVITGNKEAYTSVAFDGTNLVGFTSQAYFSARIYSDNPQGGLTSRKRSSKNSPTTNVAITFLIGGPEINNYTQTRTVINSSTNPLISSLTQASRNALSQTAINWSSNRNIARYAFKNGNVVLASGRSIAANTPVSTTLFGSSGSLQEGKNNIVLELYDLASNIATQSITIYKQTERPTTNLITEGSIELVNDRWIVDLNGVLEPGLTHEISVGGVSQPYSTFGNGTWRYFNSNMDLRHNDIEIFVRDEVSNTANRVLWDSDTVLQENQDFIEISDTSKPKVVLPYTSLPSNLVGLFELNLSEDTVGIQSGLSTLPQRRALEFAMADQSLYIHKGLEKSVYQIYGKRFDKSVVEEVDLSDYGIRISLPYPTGGKLNEIQPVYFDKASNTWKTFTGSYVHDAENHAYILNIESTGTFGLAEIASFSENLNQLAVWPNPWVPEDGIEANGTLESGITFDNLTEGARIRIYTMSGQAVVDVTPGTGSWVWMGDNRYGHDVTSGVYIYLVTDAHSKKRGKITVIR